MNEIKLTLTGDLVFHSSYFTAATMELDSMIDLCILKTSEGKILLQGSTLAGTLRSLLENIYGPGDKTVGSVFGDNSKASRITFDDCIAVNGSYEIRHGVVIDRDRKTAAPGLLYDRELAPPYIEFRITASLNSSKEKEDSDIAVLAAVKKLLESGFVTFGGSTSRGSGFCFLKNAALTRTDLGREEDLAAWLAGVKCGETRNAEPGELSESDFSMMLLEYELEFNDGVMTGERSRAPECLGDADDSDITPYFMKTPLGEYFILPGSSIKGVLRTKAEDILMRRGAAYVCEPAAVDGSCNEKFKNSNTGANDRDHRLLCPACRTFGATGYASRVLFSDLVMKAKADKSQVRKVEHLAIDRFTGGGIDSCKFDETIIESASYRGYVIVRQPGAADLDMLAHLALELNDGRLRIGHSTRKGLGRARPKLLSAKVLAGGKSDPVIKALGGPKTFAEYSGGEFVEKFAAMTATIEKGAELKHE